MPEVRDQDLDVCEECHELGGEFQEGLRRVLHDDCVGPWLAGTMQYRARLVED